MKIEDYRATYREMSQDDLMLRLIEWNDLVTDARIALRDELIARGYAAEEINAAIGNVRDHQSAADERWEPETSVLQSVKSEAYWLFGVAVFVIAVALVIHGLVWISAKLYPTAAALSVLGLVVLLLNLIPSAIFKDSRKCCGNGIVIVSYIWGAALWTYSILVLFDHWGSLGIYVGFFTFGVATVPLACLASLFKGEWSRVAELILSVAVVFSTRALGLWIASKGIDAESDIRDATEVDARPRLRLPAWLRWSLLFPGAILIDWISQSIGRIFLHTELFVTNSPSGARPFGEELIWQAWAPGWFVYGGSKIAPSHRFGATVALAGFKALIALYNGFVDVRHVLTGGSWSDLNSPTDAPVWWCVCVYATAFVVLALLCIQAHRNLKSNS